MLYRNLLITHTNTAKCLPLMQNLMGILMQYAEKGLELKILTKV